MLPFEITLEAGESPYRQVVYAATKAILGGILAPGDAFPSVRELSLALKINPNTAQKVVTVLVRDGLIAVHPGVGTIVARAPKGAAEERRKLLTVGVEQLVVEARRLGSTRDELHRAIDARWNTLFGVDDVRIAITKAPTTPRAAAAPMRGRR